jgi:hypothetical protein
LRPRVAARILVYAMKNGNFTGKKLNDYITASSFDFIGAINILNLSATVQ